MEGESVVKEKVVLKKDDKVTFRESDTDQWKEATVLLRGGKATGKYLGYMNDSSKNLHCINFNDVKELNKVDIFSSVEQVNVVMVPKQMHGDKDVVKAKLLAQWARPGRTLNRSRNHAEKYSSTSATNQRQIS